MTLLGSLIVAFTGRLAYPFELEWMEGATAVHVLRLLQGQALYTSPSIDFVPFAYPPLYYYMSAPVAWITGDALVGLRAVSIAATAGTLLVVFILGRREGGVVAALIGAAAYAGAYPLTDGWFDLGRVDALYVGLLSLVHLTAMRARSPGGWILCGILTSLAFFTKQPAILVVAPLLALLLVRDRRAAVAFGGTVFVLCATGVLLLHLATDGWHTYYVFELPRLRVGLSSRLERLWMFWTTDMLLWPVAIIGGGVMVVRRRAWRHAALASGLIGSAWIARLEGGAWANAAMPAHLAAAVMLGLWLREASSHLRGRTALAVLQLAILLHDPRRFVPTTQQLAEGKKFEESLRSAGGPVWVFDHGLWATRIGQREFAHGWAITDVVWADGGGLGRQLQDDIRRAIADRRFGSIVLDRGRSWFRTDVQRHYGQAQPVTAPVPLSGAKRRPALLFMTR